jgi:NAD(P) transhydrogenase
VDQEIRTLLRQYLEACNVSLICSAPYRTIERVGDRARINLEDGRTFTADALLFSKGRLPCIDHLRLERAGVELAKGGFIAVNEVYQTNRPHIYAAGDVIGFPALASVSAEQGRVAATHLLGREPIRSRPDLFPVAIYTIPEFSYIGKNEQELQKENIPYLSGTALYSDVAKAAISGDDRGLLKILFCPETREVLGIHVIGDQAAEIIHIGQMLMATHNRLDFIIENVFNYPTWAEAYKLAAQNGLEKLADLSVKQ